MTNEYETGMWGIFEYKNCSACGQTEDQRATDLGDRFFKRVVGLGTTGFGIGALAGSGDVIVGSLMLSVPVAYLWAKSDSVDEEE